MHFKPKLGLLIGLMLLCGTAAAEHPLVAARKEARASIATEAPASRPIESRIGKRIMEARIQGRSEKLRYHVVDGKAMLGGDMMLGDAEHVRQYGVPDFRRLLNHRSRDANKARSAQIAASNVSLAAPTGANSNGVTRAVSRWPDNTLYYTIDSAMNARARQAITDGMAMISTRSAIRFVARTNQSNYVNFMAGSGCWSYVGMIGGKQDLSLGSGCEYGYVVAHEIMHALGWQHEHQRSDRDEYLRINVANIISGMEYNFDKLPANRADAFGAYDFNSLMHYDAYAFSSNRQPTMVPVSSSVALNSFGRATNLSAGDIAAINHYYPGSSSSSSSASSASSSAPSSSSSSASSRSSSSSSSLSSSSSSFSSSSSSSAPSTSFVVTPERTSISLRATETGTIALSLTGTPDELSGNLRYTFTTSNTSVLPVSGVRIVNGTTAASKQLQLTPSQSGNATLNVTYTAASGRTSSFTVALNVSASSTSSSSSSSAANQAFVITPGSTSISLRAGQTGGVAFTLAGTPAELAGSIRYAAGISNTAVVSISGLGIANGANASSKQLRITPLRRGTSTIRLYATATSGRSSSFTINLTVR
jgi:hypothetical protein